MACNLDPDFETLVKIVERLSIEEKDKLLMILNNQQNFMVNEEVAIYRKTTPEDAGFIKKWNESITSEDFKKAVIEHIDHLPWK